MVQSSRAFRLCGFCNKHTTDKFIIKQFTSLWFEPAPSAGAFWKTAEEHKPTEKTQSLFPSKKQEVAGRVSCGRV